MLNTWKTGVSKASKAKYANASKAKYANYYDLYDMLAEKSTTNLAWRGRLEIWNTQVLQIRVEEECW